MIMSLLILQLQVPNVIVNPIPHKKEIRNSGNNYIVLHSDEGSGYTSTRRFLIRKGNSYHYYIKRSGDVVKLIDPKYKASHAGISFYEGKFGMNSHSIGIALQNNNKQTYTEKQYTSLTWLITQLRSRYKDSTSNVILRHSDIALPRGRRNDPGENFSMEKLK
jgi:N-acetylmuramoyl-L-alanine amidase